MAVNDQSLGREEPDADFGQWVRTHWRKAAAVVSPFLLPLPYGVLKEFWPALLPVPSPYLDVVPHALNTLALFLLLMFFGNPPRTAAACQGPSQGVENFGRWWHRMWWIWFSSYLIGTLLQFPNPLARGVQASALSVLRGSGDVPSAHWLLANTVVEALSLCAVGCVLMCYLVLANPRTPQLALAGKVAAIFSLLYVPSLLLVGTAYAGHLDVHTFTVSTLATALFYGSLFCVSICVLVGRLESRVIAPPLLIIVSLYTYGALQLTMNVLLAVNELPGISSETRSFAGAGIRWLLLGAVFLKALLFLFVFWLLHSGVLLFYMKWMSESSDAKEGIDQQRRTFIRDLNLQQVQLSAPGLQIAPP